MEWKNERKKKSVLQLLGTQNPESLPFNNFNWDNENDFMYACAFFFLEKMTKLTLPWNACFMEFRRIGLEKKISWKKKRRRSSKSVKQFRILINMKSLENGFKISK